ncbi:MAG TPA: amino acid ABC transporter permease [Spirochaetota bacterium]|nr:amino acid ABC transporter permease [Spirochaetota bacterium]
MAREKIPISDATLIPQKGEREIFSAWRIAFFGAIGILIFLVIYSPDPYKNIIRFLPDGIVKTFQVTVLSIMLALVIGIIAGLGRVSRVRVVNRVATVYVEVVRGIPLLVQIFYIYYALGRLVKIPDITSAIIAMAVCYGAYLAEIIRAGIQAIPRGQMEAALALGLSRGKAMRHIILPQTLRVVLPPLGNEFIALLKDSSLVSILAVSDLLRRGREFASRTFEYFETYTVVALVYLILTLFFSWLVGMMEDRLSRDVK